MGATHELGHILLKDELTLDFVMKDTSLCSCEILRQCGVVGLFNL